MDGRGVLCDVAELYLETVALRDNLHALVVANEDGCLIAGVQDGHDAHWLAALGCASATRIGRTDLLDALIAEATRGATLHTTMLRIHGETLYLTAVGGQVSRPRETAEMLGRILFSGWPRKLTHQNPRQSQRALQ